MAGFYVHIPFCRQACRYCDFHFSVSLRYIPEVVNALIEEIRDKKSFLDKLQFETLYIGGGTPSILGINELSRIIDEVFKNHAFRKDIEFTLEANPDDLNIDYLKELKRLGINRLSIGIQSFRDEDLELMRRSHNAEQAISSVRNAQNMGISNINTDLIYGIPGLTLSDWKKNLEIMLELNIQHISAYHLTFETGTVFDHWRKKGRISPVDEKTSLDQFKILKSLTGKNDFVHYEISNFGKENFFSKHNQLYWNQNSYVGIGPSAHSFDGKRRYWNISSNKEYISRLTKKQSKYYEYEDLSIDDSYNEYILTGLRTMWGIDLDEIRERFGDNYVKYTQKIATDKILFENLTIDGQKITLSTKGIFLADQIIREFFKIN